MDIRVAGNMPKRQHGDDACYDLFADQSRLVFPMTSMRLQTGTRVDIPEGNVGLVLGRSGLAFNDGITVVTGVIDAGFHGEVCVLLRNISNKTFCVKKGDRIAQLLFLSIPDTKLVKVSDKEMDAMSSERGSDGFGSTGR